VGLHAGALLARQFNLVITSWILDGAAVVTIILLLLVFQPELRRAVMRVDSVLFLWPEPTATRSESYRGIAESVFAMAETRTGALLVIRRRDSVAELVSDGILLNAQISPELLQAIFQKASPLHDGAAIIQGDRIATTNAILPLSRREDIPGNYGTRHRAALGMTERSDAMVVVVSEERGEVSLMVNGRIRKVDNAADLLRMLEQMQDRSRTAKRFTMRGAARRIFVSNIRYKLAALGLAGLIWTMSFLVAGTTVRTVSVPIQFSNVPSGMQIAEQSDTRLEVQLRGSAWLMDSVSLTKLVANFNLTRAREGRQIMRVEPGTLDLPPGIVVEKVEPDALSVLLVRRGSGTPSRSRVE
jgi:uncharacterized protein (TIGR00159 family)